MRQFQNPLAPKNRGVLGRSVEVKAWARELLTLDDDTVVTVTELACRDEGCPDIETVIGVFEPGEPIRTLRIHLPIANVRRSDIVDAMASDT